MKKRVSNAFQSRAKSLLNHAMHANSKKNQNLWVKRENHKLRIALKPTEEVKNMREKRTIESKGNGSLHFRKASAVLPS
jgi:uncharacterized membrane protein YccC